MLKNWFKKGLKIFGIALVVLILAVTFLILRFTRPQSDQQIVDEFENDTVQPTIDHFNYSDKEVRVIKMQKKIDTSLTTIVFVHGSPGSSMDFKRYLKDTALNKRANLIAYDRIGYGNHNRGEVLNSVEKELEVLNQVMNGINSEKIILVGYSYGGTIVMASPKKYKKKISLAASVRGDLEPMFWILNIYKWKFTRPLVPIVFQAAAREKLKHITELPNLENQWNISESKVLSIHGTSDKIVPFENSVFLEKIMDRDKFKLLPIEGGNHTLVWNKFNLIDKEILKSLDD
jgi:uncharacterized protein